MIAGETYPYDNDPNYLAYLAQDRPLWRETMATTRPEQAVFQPLSDGEQHELITTNLQIVDSAVQRMIVDGANIDIEEATQDGAEGLCDAARRFDPSKQTSFTTYAPYRVRGAIVDGVRRYNKLAGEHRTGSRVVSLLNNTRARSIFAPIAPLGHGDSITLEEVIPADQPSTEALVEDRETFITLYEMIDLLEGRQREVILLKLQDLSRNVIATTLGISVSTVGRDLRKARSALKDMLQPHLFES